MPAPGPDKELCGAQLPKRPQGTTCKQPAGHGTKHLGVGCCSRHGGNTESHEKAAGVELARRECVTLGIPVDTNPAEALLRSVREAAGNVEFYRQLVQELPTHPADDVLVPATIVANEDGTTGQIAAHWERGDPGVYGRTYHVSGMPTGEAKPHVLVQLYNEERKHLAAVATAALRAGVQERFVQLAEAQAGTLAEVLKDLVKRLGHDPAAPKTREAMRGALTLVAGGRA